MLEKRKPPVPPMPTHLKSLLYWGMLAALAAAWSIRPAPLPRALVEGTPESATGLQVAGTAAGRSGAGRTTPGDPSSQPARGPVITITWAQLRALNTQTGETGPVLRGLNGRTVRIPGFIVPLEDFQEVFKEFLLVPYYGACVHTPPPPPNQMIYATASGRSVRAEWWAPVWLEGTLTITPYRSVYGVAGFRMTVDRITPYRED